MGKVFKAAGLPPRTKIGNAPAGKLDTMGDKLADMKKTGDEKNAARAGKNTVAQTLYPHLD